MILVSACLLGDNCKYNGDSNLNPTLVKLLKDKDTIAICPEQLGGLPTPRIPCEILNGTGNTVLAGISKVINKNGNNLTNSFIYGAQQTLTYAKDNKVNLAILKSKSPSWGVNLIYDGSFSSRLKKGDGVTTALLKKHNIKVLSEEEYIKGVNFNESN